MGTTSRNYAGASYIVEIEHVAAYLAWMGHIGIPILVENGLFAYREHTICLHPFVCEGFSADLGGEPNRYSVTFIFGSSSQDPSTYVLSSESFCH